jgi:hypothetical protein
MIQRSLTVEKLASDCGVKPITLSNQIAKNFPSRRLRLIVETVLNLPIWSSAAEFESRRLLISRCGFNPFTLTTTELQQRVAGFKIRWRSKNKTRSALIDLLAKHLSTQPVTNSHNT